MQLYHASNITVAEPIIINRFTTLDFGAGFYTTTNYEQAKDFAKKVFIRRGRKGIPTVNIYKFNEGAAQKELSFLTFEEPNKEWFDFVVYNRAHGRDETINPDVIVGPVANDDVFETVALYEAGQLSAQEAIERFKVKQLYNQVLFCNMEALSYLSFIESKVEDIAL